MNARPRQAARPGAKSARRPAPPATPAARAAAPSWPADIAAAAEVLAASPGKHVMALVGAGLKSAAGVQALLARRLQNLRDTFAELRTVGTVMRHAGLRESLAHLDGLARGSVELALSHGRELVDVAVSTQKDALAILARRLDEDVDEFRLRRSRLRASRAA